MKMYQQMRLFSIKLNGGYIVATAKNEGRKMAILKYLEVYN
jgi:hypothetical protein